MNWAQWLIPLIAVAVWILSSLVKTQQEQARRNANRLQPRRREPEEDDADRRATERANRLLEEIRRRKQREAQPPPKPALPAPKKAITTAQRIEDLDIALDARKASMSWEEAKPVIPEAVLVPAAPAPRVHVPASVARPLSKIAHNLQILLKNRQTLAASVLLSDLLGPPRCKRPK